MSSLSKSFFKLSTLLCLIVSLSGCAILGLTVPAAVSGCALEVNYTFSNIAYKTICYPFTDVDAALNKVLKKMDIKSTKRNAEDGKISVTAATSNLDIYIELEKVTPTVTSIKVNAKKGVFFKDKATATEIIVQTEKNVAAKDNPTHSIAN